MSESKVNNSIKQENKLFKNIRLKTRLIFVQWLESASRPQKHNNCGVNEDYLVWIQRIVKNVHVERVLSEYNLLLRKDSIRWSNNSRVGRTYSEYSAFNSLKFLSDEIKFLQNSSTSTAILCLRAKEYD